MINIQKNILGFIIILLILFDSLLVFSQTPSRQFMEVFERETQNIRQNNQFANFKNISYLSFFPDTLPSWFFNPPTSTDQIIYAIGISDPDMDAEDAYSQAFYRARILAVLFNSARIQYFRDVFTSVQDGMQNHEYRQRFDTYFRISANENTGIGQFTVIDQHLTRYNESLVLIGFNNIPALENENNLTRISATASVLYIEAQIGDAFEPQASFDFVSQIEQSGFKSQKAAFHAIKKGNREQSSSVFLNTKIDFPLFVYRYCNPAWQPFTQPLVSHQGLWGIYIQQMLEHITLTTEQSSLRLRSMDQQSTPESSNLAREISTLSARIQLLEIDFSPKQILFEMSMQQMP